MKLQIRDIIGKHKGEPCLVMGLGPSLNPHLDRLEKHKGDGILQISCNHWFDVMDTKIDYWVLSNSDDTIKNLHPKINEFKIPVFYAESVDDTSREFVDAALKYDYLPFDERHFNDVPYHSSLVKIGNCCDRITPGRLTLQEELQKLSGHKERNSFVCSVAEHCISFAILFQCNPIYVVGVDLDYNLGYAGKKKKLEVYRPPGFLGFEPHKHIIIDNLRILNEHAKKLGIQIYNISETPAFSSFERGKI